MIKHKCSIEARHIAPNGSRINEVLKGVAQMFQVNRMPDTPFKILFNLLLSAVFS